MRTLLFEAHVGRFEEVVGGTGAAPQREGQIRGGRWYIWGKG